jgi:hypothetical protein
MCSHSQKLKSKTFSTLEVLTLQHLIQISVAVVPLATLHQLLTNAGAAALDQLQRMVGALNVNNCNWTCEAWYVD